MGFAKNKEIAKIFYRIAIYLSTQDSDFKPYIYRRAASNLEKLENDVGQIYLKGGNKALEEIPGVGQAIALKIEEYLKTGKIKHYEELKKAMPMDIDELISVEGLGPRKAKILYQKLKIKNIKDLEAAAKSHKIAALDGFGETTEKNILQGITFLKRSQGRFLLGDILPQAREICKILSKNKIIKKASLAGSLRRRKETIADIDILATTEKPKQAMDFFVNLPNVVKVWGKGNTKSSVRLRPGFDVDLRIVPEKSYGAALQYFTGSKEHNIATRRIAMSKRLKLNEYGLFKGSKQIAGRNEKNIYLALGLPYIEPEIRENQGEIEAAIQDKLPQLIEKRDIKGDLHCHSKWDGGDNSIKEMASVAQKMGYEYIGISDHAKFLRIENGLNEKQLARQRKEIDKVNKMFQVSRFKFHVLQGAETNILKDGRIDIKDEALKKLDYAIAGIHSFHKMPRKEMTERIILAMKNPYIKILAHPTGRKLKKRDEFQMDFDKILRAAKQFNVVLEINSAPERLDLDDQYIRRAKEARVKMIVGSDAHNKEQLEIIGFGVFQARRGWAEKKDIINSQPLKKLVQALKSTGKYPII